MLAFPKAHKSSLSIEIRNYNIYYSYVKKLYVKKYSFSCSANLCYMFASTTIHAGLFDETYDSCTLLLKKSMFIVCLSFYYSRLAIRLGIQLMQEKNFDSGGRLTLHVRIFKIKI